MRGFTNSNNKLTFAHPDLGYEGTPRGYYKGQTVRFLGVWWNTKTDFRLLLFRHLLVSAFKSHWHIIFPKMVI